MNNHAIPYMTDNMAVSICTLCEDNQHYLNMMTT